ncbi:uracil-DNA glycosylase, partial [Herbaspirillum sp. HC18]
MQYITLDTETDFDGWRKAARSLVLHHVNPADVTWTVRGGEADLFAPPSPSPILEVNEGTFNVPGKFVELAKAAI